MEPQTKSKNIGITLGVIVVLAVIATVVFSQKKTDTAVLPSTDTTSDVSTVPTKPVTIPTQTPSVPVVTTPGDTTKKSVYKDGTYTATGSYMSPGGLDHLGVTLTIKDDVVTNSTVVNEAGDGTSRRYQTMFIDGYKQYVVGKNVSAVVVSKVSGSSLTCKGFNDALAQIKAQAKA